MSREPSTSASRDLRALLESRSTAGLSDAQLLRRYVDRRAEAEAAFEALVDRHGPMVWGVCRRALGPSHEAEDAFQATFLVLARRADAVRVDGSLGRWLHGVASKVAVKARSNRRRRLARELEGKAVEPAVHPPDHERAELLAALDEELARLPEKYRSPLVLCHLEGLTYAESAERLGCPPGAIKGRLTRGRELLRTRLARRGLGLPASSIVDDPRPAVPPLLARSIVRAASSSATVAGASTTAFILAKGVVQTMFMTRTIKILALVAPALVVVGFWVESAHPEPKGPPPLVAANQAPAARGDLVVLLPSKDDLRVLLRQAAEEVGAIAQNDPQPAAGTLATIAQVQAKAGDLEGAKTTFAVAVRAAGGDLGGLPISRTLLVVGQVQAEAGFRKEAGETFRRALETAPGFARDIARDWQSLQTLVDLVKEQAGLGDRVEARRAADRLQAFVADLFARSETTNAEDVFAPNIAGALAAVDDFEGAFQRVKTTTNGDWVAAEAALSAAKYLDKDRAHRYVAEAVAQIAALNPPFGKTKSLSDLAEAQARLGDFDAAKATARSIGDGPKPVSDLLPDGWTLAISAMARIADVQQAAGQVEPARQTLREARRMIVDHPRNWGFMNPNLGIAMAQIRAGDIDGALSSIASANEGTRAPTLAQIARAQALAGQSEAARKSIDRALAEARAIAQAPPKPIAGSQPDAKAKTSDPGVSITGKLEGYSGTDPKPIAGFQPAAKTKTSLPEGFSTAKFEVVSSPDPKPIAGSHQLAAKAKTSDVGITTLKTEVFSGTDPKPISGAPLSPSVEVAEIQAMAGDISGALKTLRALDNEYDRRYALKRVVTARAAAGDVKEALDLATRDARTAVDRRLALEGLVQGVEIRLDREPR